MRVAPTSFLMDSCKWSALVNMDNLLNPPMNLFISIPSNRDWKGKFGASFAGVISHLMAKGVAGYKLTNFYMSALGQASCINAARQRFIDEMLAGTYTHWLSLDDDMTFPLDLVSQLAAHDKDIVAINARHKTDEVKGSLVDFNGDYLNSFGKTGLEEVKSIGGAIFLARIDAIRPIPKPHFETRWIPEKNDYLSEDRYFAALLEQHGVKMYCDHDCSQLVKHIGDYEYGWTDTKVIVNPTIEVKEKSKVKNEKIELFYDGLTLIDKAA